MTVASGYENVRLFAVGENFRGNAVPMELLKDGDFRVTSESLPLGANGFEFTCLRHGLNTDHGASVSRSMHDCPWLEAD